MTDILPKAKANIILDASKIDLFETCPERYNLRHNRNKTLPIAEKNKSLDLGGLGHEGFAVYYDMLAKGFAYCERVEACLKKIQALASDPEQSNSDPEDVGNLLVSVEQNLDYWRAEDENSLEVLAVEQPFAYELFSDDDVRFILSGKIDLLVNFHGIGRAASYQRLPFDHKTFQRDYPPQRLNNQFINYANAVNSMTLIVNRVGLHDPFAKKPKTAEEKFKRVVLSYDPVYIQQWKDNLTKMLMNEYLTCIATDFWPKKPTSCNKFNRLCEYYTGYCDRSGEDAREEGLRDLFVDGDVWDVTKNLTDGGDK